MKFVERNHIDVARWNTLVDSTSDATFFSYAWYLDATAENWCALVNDDYTAGIALPFSLRLGVETLYTPIFVRYVEWLGHVEQQEQARQLILGRFENRHICMRQPLLGDDSEKYCFQSIRDFSTHKLGSQAKRMLKKADKAAVEITISDDYDCIAEVIEEELNGKFAGIDSHSLVALNKLFEAARQQQVLKTFALGESGGIVCLQKEGQLLYLKGTVSPDAKSNGGMYAALNTAIEHAKESNCVFDFGGSRIEGVRKFNHHLGGADEHYYCYKLDSTPFWFKFARRIKHTWKK